MKRSPASVQATEVRYGLHSLGWKSFQDLCATVMREVLGQTVQIFLSSKDGGRDGAFQGSWKPAKGESITGTFVFQCKFTSKPNKLLTQSALEDEYNKARTLAKRGLCENYILMTNYGVGAETEAAIRAHFLGIPGIKNFVLYGEDWLGQTIRESSRLRMMVPRVYGLGDLSQILDERAYAQAVEILSSLGDDLATFVITDAHRKSVKALVEKGFVFLLGEPASGKSTIAASLALGAIDIWGCSTIKVRTPEEFVRHSNPHEPKQFFWVDDVFGPTQYQWDLAVAWNNAIPHLKAAIRRGARVVFTSRDYIYKSAKRDLKLHAFPLFTDSQVVINVQQLSKIEREQILYNHVRLGNQPVQFRTSIKRYLETVSRHHDFKPEIARRFGDSFFTRNLEISLASIVNFVEHPVEFLKDIVSSLDAESKAAIAVIFMSGGTVESPLELTAKLQTAVDMLGGTTAGVRHALAALEGSLTKLVTSAGKTSWTYRHPTIGDAFTEVVSENPELLDIYLHGTKIDKLVREIVVGDAEVEGAKVRVSENRYAELANRLNREPHVERICRFLGSRCGRSFLEFYFATCPSVLDYVCKPGSWLHATLQTELLPKLQEFGLLPGEMRQTLIYTVRNLAVTTPDADFLTVERVKQVFTPEEIRLFTEALREELIPHLYDTVWNWKSNYDSGDDPDEHFQSLSEALDAYVAEFADDSELVAAIEENQQLITDCIADLRSENPQPDYDWRDDDDSPRALPGLHRSVFDDVDH